MNGIHKEFYICAYKPHGIQPYLHTTLVSFLASPYALQECSKANEKSS